MPSQVTLDTINNVSSPLGGFDGNYNTPKISNKYGNHNFGTRNVNKKNVGKPTNFNHVEVYIWKYMNLRYKIAHVGWQYDLMGDYNSIHKLVHWEDEITMN